MLFAYLKNFEEIRKARTERLPWEGKTAYLVF
jgi:hypothetical protein